MTRGVSAIEPALSQADLDWAPCLSSDDLSEAGAQLILAGRQLDSPSAITSMLKSLVTAAFFREMEAVFAHPDDPRPRLIEVVTRLARFLISAAEGGIGELVQVTDADGQRQRAEDPEATTAQHYGRLFEGFSSDAYWTEARRLLGLRLERNGINQRLFVGKDVLDAGCGGGRYTCAWRGLGARFALGIDISMRGVTEARFQSNASGLEAVGFVQGSALSLPIPSGSFDVVFSNGVLHHTVNWVQGVRELVRVLRPGGLGWLYLIEDPGGLFWDSIELLRVLLRGESKEVAVACLTAVGLPKNRVFYVLDHVMVPINLRLRPEDVERALREGGASSIIRLRRGTDFDRIERIYQGEPFAELKFGVGENRYVFSRAET